MQATWARGLARNDDVWAARRLPKPPRSDSFKEVTERPCLRCHQSLTLEGGQLVYCSYCGAPQIFLSEELQEQAATEVQQYQDRATAASAPAVEAVDLTGLPAAERWKVRREMRARRGQWPLAIEYALLSGAIALGLNLAALLFSPLLLLAWLWVVSAPILTVGFYHARRRAGQLTAGFAARLGLLTGLLIFVGCVIVFALGLVVARFALHNITIDGQIADAVAQIRANAQAQYGNAAEPMLRLLGIPEFRVGFLLWMLTVTAAIYLLISTAAAGVMGLVLGRRRPA